MRQPHRRYGSQTAHENIWEQNIRRDSRLFRLKQRALPWYFIIKHFSGNTNHAADAASRHPSPSNDVDTLTVTDTSEAVIAAAIRMDTESLTSITWDLLQKETNTYPGMFNFLRATRKGFPDEFRHITSAIPFWQYRHGLYESDGVILHNDRVVIPLSSFSGITDPSFGAPRSHNHG